MAAFEAAGVTIDALVTAQDRGDISFATYDEPARATRSAVGA
jgi:hypothetical protein